ncbi:hypothetical protein [Skermania piniformis]|uniref:beta-mannosidase n=1 Tax=Skermania pinensis TaxID=39122 RepID=A0ABX8S913_9ACTN|nr:hypothetical protein [Skermania piniformis]QXQ13961.1 hypothetical protein KV203_00335 [Skermania piniformis]
MTAVPVVPVGWTVVQTGPDEFGTPDELEAAWSAGIVVPGPASTVAAMLAGAHEPVPTDVDAYDWWLRTTLDLPAPARLEFAGLTVPATVFVDRAPVAAAESMFLPLTVAVPAGRTEVCLRFGSLHRWLRTRRPRGRWRATLVTAQGLRWSRSTLLGRAPAYGGGRIPAPVGAWRPMLLRSAAIAGLRLEPDPATGAVRVAGRLVAATGPIRLQLRDGTDTVLVDREIPVPESFFAETVQVPQPQLWYPNGYGRQVCYRLVLRVGDQVLADRIFGFRTIVADRANGGFGLAVNGVPVFARGVAWFPPDPVALTAEPELLRARLAAFAAAGATMVRCVGGLVYEQPEFYRYCAELGLLVWQDAMQATFDPPAEIGELICRELQQLLDELSGNPALAVVSGGSETEQQPELLGVPASGRQLPLLTEQLPALIATHADVPYVTSSPSSPGGQLAVRPDVGVSHWFGVGGYLRPTADVQVAGVRFAAEALAFAIPPEPAAVERHFGTAAKAGHHPDWKAGVPRDRTAAWDFEDVRDHYVREIFGIEPAAVRRIDPHRYLQLGRLAVAEAMAACFAFWRRPDSGCRGGLVLGSADLAPGPGWGLLDSDGAAKLPLAVLSRRWAPIGLTVTDAGLAGLRIDLHNDTPDPVLGTLVLRATDAHGHPVADGELDVIVAAHSSRSWHDSDLTGGFADLTHAYRFGPPLATGVVVVLHGPDGAGPARDARVLAPVAAPVAAGLTATAARVGQTWYVTVTAAAAVRYVGIDAPGWTAADNWFDLPAGAPYRVELRPDPGADPAAAPRGRVESIDALDPALLTAVSDTAVSDTADVG